MYFIKKVKYKKNIRKENSIVISAVLFLHVNAFYRGGKKIA